MKLSIIAAALLCGCAAYRPIIDAKGVDPLAFERDLGECQSYAAQAAGPGEGAVAGAIVGALLGAFVAPRGYKNYAAGKVGGIAGAVGGLEGGKSQQDVVRRCMAGRGYKVLQ